MLGNITIGQYFPGESVIHRADPRVKIILAVGLMMLVFIINSIFALLLTCILVVVTIKVSNIPLKYTLKGLKPIFIILIFTTVVNVFFTQGTPLFDLGFIHISYEGLERAGITALRIVLLILSASILTLTTTPIQLTDGLEKLMAPLNYIKVPVHEISMMMTISLRFIPTLIEETDKIIKAQSARGADFDTGGLIAKAKSFVPVLVPLFVSSFKRADELATAMEARCYRGSEGRTRMKQLRFTRVDLNIFMTFIISVTIIVIVQIFI